MGPAENQRESSGVCLNESHGSPTVGFRTVTAVAFTARVSTSLAIVPAGTGSWAMPR